MIEHFSMRVVDSYMLAPTVRHLVFERSDGQPQPMLPGQFLQIHFDYEGKPSKRSYSVASIVAEGRQDVDRVEVAVSYIDGGAATHVLSRIEDGQEVGAAGPYGRFCLQPDDAYKRYLLFATGTGIAPYRAMLPQIAQWLRERDCEFVLVQGARNPTELLYGEEFEAFAQAHERFAYHACVSRAARPEPRPNDHGGHVQDLLPLIHPDGEHDIAYLCGNPAMVDDTFALLKDAGLSVRQIRREKYVSSR